MPAESLTPGWLAHTETPMDLAHTPPAKMPDRSAEIALDAEEAMLEQVARMAGPEMPGGKGKK